MGINRSGRAVVKIIRYISDNDQKNYRHYTIIMAYIYIMIRPEYYTTVEHAIRFRVRFIPRYILYNILNE